VGVPAVPQQLFDCGTRSGDLIIRRYLGEGNQYETPFVEPRMRQNQPLIPPDQSPHAQQVQIDRARPPAFVPDAAKLLLDLLHPRQQLQGRQQCGEPHHHIEEIGLLLPADRFGLVEAGKAPEADSSPPQCLQRPDQILFAISEVGTQAEKGLRGAAGRIQLHGDDG